MINKKMKCIVLLFLMILSYGSFNLYYSMVKNNILDIVLNLSFIFFLGSGFIVGCIAYDLNRKILEYNIKTKNTKQNQEQIHLAVSIDHLYYSLERITCMLLIISLVLFIIGL